ncbi:MAG: leucine-rich repeat domain-containing protein, partial [Clostridia bacterium]|nr:leucine-rich repeat domain-containing protein [Clostridia bacterium]
GAFRNCVGLTSVSLPRGIEKIDADTFSGCTALTEIVIPDTVTEIEAGAFSGCAKVANLVIPESVTEINKKPAFSDCKALRTVQIPRRFKSEIKEILPSELVKLFGGVKINYV